MSKPHVSPYRRNAYNNQRSGVSPLREEPSKLAEVTNSNKQKSKLSHSLISDQLIDKRAPPSKEEVYRQTEKKRAYEYSGVSHNRLDTLVEQNKFLLAENNQLANLLNQRNRMIMALEQKLQQQIAQEVMTLQEIEIQKNRFLEEYAQKMQENSATNECLMDQIARLNQDLYQLELSKNREIENIKQTYSKEHKNQLENILNNHAQTLEIMTIQNNKLKEVISNRDNQIECLNHEIKSTNERMKSKSQELEKNLNHVTHMKKLELSEQKIMFQKMIEDVKRQCQKQNQINASLHEAEIKKVRKQLLTKQFEVQKLGNDISENHIDSQIKINELYQKKAELENQISELQSFHRTLVFQEAQRIKSLSKAELENNDNMNSQIIEGLRRQIGRLQNLNETRAEQITKLYSQIDQLRGKHDLQCQDLRLQIENFKSLIHEEKQNYEEENQGVKTKIAQLRHADLQSIQNYYQNQLATMAEDLKEKQTIIQENRQKLHLEIQEKTQLRKNFEIETSKLKMRIGELELRIAGVIQEKKEEVASFGSQMQMTSMSLLRSAQQKEKYSVFSQSQKQKLQVMIDNKDIEIEQLNQKIQILTQNHAEQIANKNSEIKFLSKTIEQLETTLKKQKIFYDSELQKKQSLHLNDKQFYESEIEKLKREFNDQYAKTLEHFTKQRSIVEEQRAKLRQSEKELMTQLKSLKQLRQMQNIDKQIAMSDQKQKVLEQKQSVESKLKAFYEKEIQVKDNEIGDLRKQISELNNDIRIHIQKQNKLEDKLKRLLESQEKLRDMQQRVMALGQQNNLVKNLSQIVKNRRK